jgi:hypothetical protein
MPAENHVPTIDDVDEIARLNDPVIRNLQITQCYHQLALAMRRGSGHDANWCSFATWASKQAGQTIRKQDLARAIEAIFQAEFAAEALTVEFSASAQALGSSLDAAQIQLAVIEAVRPLGPVAKASDAVARGNLKVFAEIGREFARFLALGLKDESPDLARLDAFCQSLRPGNPPDGQRYLQQAFTRYYEASFETDARKRAQLMLLANIEIGYHEQTRLQPEIAEAMDAALIDYRVFRQQLIAALFPERAWWVSLRLFLLRLIHRPSPLEALLDGLLAQARRIAHLLITEYLMSIDLPPDLHLRLGRDVLGGFPESLRQIDLAELKAMLDLFDPTPDSTRGSGAVDWARLEDRLHYIADLFRCYQAAADLFTPPFRPEQVRSFKMGQIPDGRL